VAIEKPKEEVKQPVVEKSSPKKDKDNHKKEQTQLIYVAVGDHKEEEIKHESPVKQHHHRDEPAHKEKGPEVDEDGFQLVG